MWIKVIHMWIKVINMWITFIHMLIEFLFQKMRIPKNSEKTRFFYRVATCSNFISKLLEIFLF